MISKLYTIISDKLWDLSLYFGDRYNGWVFASQQKALGPCKCVRFRAMQTYTSYILAICWHLSAFKSSSHEKSIFLKIHTFFSFKFFQGQNWLTNYPDSELHGYWKTMTLSSVSPNLIFSVLAEFVLWEYSIVSSLSWYSILVQHACNDRAWLTSECSPRYDNFGTVKIAVRRDSRHVTSRHEHPQRFVYCRRYKGFANNFSITSKQDEQERF